MNVVTVLSTDAAEGLTIPQASTIAKIEAAFGDWRDASAHRNG